MKNIVVLIILSFALFGCIREGVDHPCYDNTLINDIDCNSDCPGFEGCDGTIYCNECEAALVGLGPK